MHILITNLELTEPGGTVSYIQDLVPALTAKGHHVEIYTYWIGTVGEQIKNTGINVVSNLADCKEVPDIIHAHHFAVTADALFWFKNTPVIYFVHNRNGPFDIPPVNKQVIKYISIDYNCYDRLLNDKRIPSVDTTVIFNWINTDRFRLRDSFADKPLRALVFSNYGNCINFFTTIKSACQSEGISLDAIGMRFDNTVYNPEDHLVQYDLVFAKDKAAIEALGTGAAVVLCDFPGLGVMVSQENFLHLRDYNFGMKTLIRPIEVELLREEIHKFNKEENMANAKAIREISSLEVMAAKLVQTYHDTIKQYAEGKRGHAGNTMWLKISAKLNKLYFLNSRKLIVRIIFRMYLIFRKVFGIKN